MAKALDGITSISNLPTSNLWVIYGKSSSGKTWLSGTFPKPMLVLKIGDNGLQTIANVEGIEVLTINNPAHLKDVLIELQNNKKYKTILADTFSLSVNEWVNENSTNKKKRMSQQMWGDLKTDSEELIRLAQKLSINRIVVLTCHEATDAFEGMEDEILPDIRASVSKGSRTYLEGMANYGVHTIKVRRDRINKKTGETEEIIKYAAQIGPDPYYWTKLQIDPAVKVPKLVFNPTFDKLQEIINGGISNE